MYFFKKKIMGELNPFFDLVVGWGKMWCSCENEDVVLWILNQLN